MVHNNHLQGEAKRYYETGKLKSIEEILVYNDSVEYNNNVRVYKKNGELDRNNTFYVELLLKNDTVSLNDSLKVGFKILIPENSEARAYPGSIEECMNNVNYNNVNFIQSKYYYFKPKRIGMNFLEIVFEIGVPNKNRFYKKFLKKNIYVTD